MKLDFLAFAAHPDDVELSIGGTIKTIINKNKTFGVIDLTQGELGSRGTKETRAKETKNATEILGLTIRKNLGLPDGNIFVNEENTIKMIEQIRKFKPEVIFAPYFNDRHPDHIETSKLIKRAYFLSGVTKIKTTLEGKEQEAYRPKKLFYFMQTFEFEPSFIVDISETFEDKMKSVLAYKTQFYNKELDETEPKTFISSPEFVKYLEARAKSYGFKIGKEYGEPFFSEEEIELDILNYTENL